MSYKNAWEAYHESWGMDLVEIEVGDLVRHNYCDEDIVEKVLEIDYGAMNIKVITVKSENPHWDIGDVEENLIRRYHLVEKQSKGS